MPYTNAGNNTPRDNRQNPCQIIGVSSGKGGVGKTNLIVNLGVVFSRWNYRVIILDGDLGMSNVEILFKVKPPFTLYDAINGDKSLTDVMVEAEKRIKLISGGSGIFHLANMDKQQQERLFHTLPRLGSMADILLIDTGAGLSREIIRFLTSTDTIVLITTTEPTAMTDVYGLIKVLDQIKTKKAHLVVNMAEKQGDGEDTFERINLVTRKNLHHIKLSYLGEIPKDQLVPNSIKNRCPLVSYSPNSQISASIENIAKRVVYDEDMSKMELNLKGMRGFIERLKKNITSHP